MDSHTFTNSQLTTYKSVKEILINNLDIKDITIANLTKKVGEHLLFLAGVLKQKGYEALIIQGSGTFSIESVLGSVIGKNDNLLILVNGVHGNRIRRIAEVQDINFKLIEYCENESPNLDQVKEILDADSTISHIIMVHCETINGIINPLQGLGKLCESYRKVFIVDAMNSFGAIPISIKDDKINILIASTRHLSDGVPGFCFVIASNKPIKKVRKYAGTFSYDSQTQWFKSSDKSRFNFTPFAQSILAINEALELLDKEGGLEVRSSRYRKNYETLVIGMTKLGFKTFPENGKRSCIITSFNYPVHPNFNFHKFYSLLFKKGFVIYPCRFTNAECFRIRTTGHHNFVFYEAMIGAVEDVLKEMDCFPLAN